MAGDLAEAFAAVKDKLPKNLGIVASQKMEREKSNMETEILILAHSRAGQKSEPVLSDDEKLIVHAVVEKYIAPVKGSPFLVKGKIATLEQEIVFQRKKGHKKMVIALEATLNCFRTVNMFLIIHNHWVKEGRESDNLEWWKEAIVEKAIKFPHFGYIFHPEYS
ncbi:MAG: hypothetical protein PHT40_00920 [Patescibacteria group bacterium]|nr:hypothetical protein [Patescibacteria group bacterium]